MSRLLPFIGFMLLVGLFGFGIWWNTQHDPNAIPSPLLDKPAPTFNLPQLYEPTRMVSKADLLNHVAMEERLAAAPVNKILYGKPATDLSFTVDKPELLAVFAEHART